MAQCQGPNFTVVTVQPLDSFELQPLWLENTSLRMGGLHLISIPIFEHLIFPHRPEVMRTFLKCHLHNTLVMRKNGLVTVTKIESPDFDVFVRRTRYDKF